MCYFPCDDVHFGESAGRYHLRLCRSANQIALQKGTVSHMHEKNKLENSLATDEKKQRSLWQEAWRRFRKNRMAMIGLAFIAFLVLVSIATLVIDVTTHNAIYNEYVVKQDLFNRLKGPRVHAIPCLPAALPFCWRCAQAVFSVHFPVTTAAQQIQSSCEQWTCCWRFRPCFWQLRS